MLRFENCHTKNRNNVAIMDEWTIDLRDKVTEYEVEFGSTSPVQFANTEGSPWTAKMCHADGSEVLCKCGKPATQTLIGRESFLARCEECL